MNLPSRKRQGRKAGPPRTASPILRSLFGEIDRRRLSLTHLAHVLDISQSLLFNYRSGRTEPGVMRVEELADFLGFRLELVPIDKENENDKPTGTKAKTL